VAPLQQLAPIPAMQAAWRELKAQLNELKMPWFIKAGD
jgi:hypothetical protein